MTIKEDKKALRKVMLEKRKDFNPSQAKEYSSWICLELEKLIVNRNCRFVHAYIPIANEIDISPLLDKLISLNITVICPKTLPKRKLENRILYSLDELETGIMGTRHPMHTDVYDGEMDFIIVPGLAFDKEQYRLGYGGGYYDNFLINYPNAYKVGIFFPFQEIDAVPMEPHDVRLDEILIKEF